MSYVDIDIKTVLLFLFLGNLMAAILFTAYRLGAKGKADVFDTLFLLGKLSQAWAWLLIALHGDIPEEMSLVAGNLFLVTGQAMECFALSSLAEISHKWWGWIFGTLALLAAGFSLQLTYPEGLDVGLALISAAMVFFYAVTGWVFLLLPRSRSCLTWLLGLLYSASAFGIFCRALSLLFPGESYPLVSQNAFQLLALSLLSLVMFASNIGYILVKKDSLDRMLFHMATRDALTGAFNRASFKDEAQRFWALAERNRSNFSLLMLDLDHFKQVNDSCGHPVGDRVLQEVVGVIAGCLRPYDVLGRYGGEEFTVLLPGTCIEEAEGVAERIRRGVEGHVFQDQCISQCTVSIGVASCFPCRRGTALDDLIRFSDDALYEAKHRGRNSVVAFPGDSSSFLPLPDDEREAVSFRGSDSSE